MMANTTNATDLATSAPGTGTDALHAHGPRFALPTARLIAAVAGSTIAVGGGWAAAVALGAGDATDRTSAFTGAGVVAATSLIGLLILGPWKVRPVLDWMMAWLGVTVFRFLVTPVAAWVLYSATSSSLAVKPFALAIALAYGVVLLIEVAVVARAVGRSTPGFPGTPGRNPVIRGTAGRNPKGNNSTHAHLPPVSGD